VTRAIDCLVNVNFADQKQPEWMVRVKEDYFKGGDSFFSSPELPELLENMDANGVEKAVLITGARATDDRAQRFAEAAPDRFRLAVGGFNLLKPMKTVRALESFVRDHPVACATVGPSFWGDGMYPPTDPVYYPLYTKCCELVGHADLLFSVHGEARRLLAVAQGGVEDANVTHKYPRKLRYQ